MIYHTMIPESAPLFTLDVAYIISTILDILKKASRIPLSRSMDAHLIIHSHSNSNCIVSLPHASILVMSSFQYDHPLKPISG